MAELDTTYEQVTPLADVSEGRLRVLTLVHGGPRRQMLLDGRTWCLGRSPGTDGWALEDGNTSRRHAELVFDDAKGTYRLKDLESRNGSYLNGVKTSEGILEDGDVIRVGGSIFVYQDLEHIPGRPIPGLEALGDTSFVRGLAEAAADLAAKSSLPILILGPTGAGKEIMAHRIHDKSGRKGPIIVANCATFSRELVGSELFGHVAGAFTGAKTARGGLFAAADGGTLFLDEIAELPFELQAVLLRVLQEQRFRPIGSDQEIEVDVRIVSATHQRLDKKSTSFRADLYARLAGFVVDLPGLAERRDEVLGLFQRFLGGGAISTPAAEALLLYGWPLNVRELKHAAEHAKLFARGATVEVGHLPPALTQKKPTAPNTSDAEEEVAAPSADELRAMLTTHLGSVAEVAKALGKHRNQIYRWLKRYQLDPERFRSPKT